MELGVYELIKDFIGSLGFPIFVAVYLLWRMEKLLKDLKKTIDELGVLIMSMLPALNQLARGNPGAENGDTRETPKP